MLTITLLLTSPPLAAQSREEIALAKSVLSQLQVRSIRENREYCGYLAYDFGDRLIATPATRGTADSCLWEGDEDGLVLVISYHTHAAYDPEYGSEWPSVTDMEGDEDEGVDGFVSTPGGRLWYIDTEAMETWQVCGIGCLPADPAFRREPEGVERSYTYDELLWLEGN
ncbi:MAG: DUF4329 domain-containing protein [Pseudomonadota bacterium]